jgi:hypothetical protein
MRYTNTSTTPRMARQHPGEGRLDSFDCELPAGARSELTEREQRRPPARINQRQTPARVIPSWLPWRPDLRPGIVCAPIAIIAVIAGLLTLFGAIPRDSSTEMQHPMAAPIAPAVQTPAVQMPAAPRWTEVRRAELAPVTVKRAEQVLRIGKWNQVWMPDGSLTWVRFWGVKDAFADLPSSPQTGDAWGVLEGGQHALWVWHILPGHTTPAWVDP